ncbi:hypothetical protein FRC10_012038 [Ceratobasidium sp. 414]|nr:hypothetical protein FRC10_012038 [Ceratobasidium sp. 414]
MNSIHPLGSFRQRLDEELSTPGVIQQRETKVRRIPIITQSAVLDTSTVQTPTSVHIVLIHSILAASLGNIDRTLDIVLVKRLTKLRLSLAGKGIRLRDTYGIIPDLGDE